ncbi:EthD family reductase [Smaragdicoccus niigatensis]|uniref:EthD family reductase n=1 Tax=Smaragdicoccus niigatensis TaxID=359359 RepID=UPI00039E5FE4|nr:EthD family reductase [Smaragdicoccus niigatensis]
MVRFLVMYQQPTDVDAFEQHYRDVHIPLAKGLPGLRRYAVSRNVRPVRGEAQFYLVAELEWDDMESLRRDFASPDGRATAADVETLAQWSAVQSMIYEPEDV